MMSMSEFIKYIAVCSETHWERKWKMVWPVDGLSSKYWYGLLDKHQSDSSIGGQATEERV